jgi:hypothetical protein
MEFGAIDPNRAPEIDFNPNDTVTRSERSQVGYHPPDFEER